MADRKVDHLLIGGGMASADCAAELRKRGAEGSILLVGREPEPPYDRPPLSKEYLRGEAGREDAFVNPPEWYEENDVELLTRTNVMALDLETRTAKLQGGEEVEFGTALLATGAIVNILRVDGAQLEGIHYLRAFGNSDSIRDDAAKAERVVLIGGSYIGCEVAASLTAKGKRLHDRDDRGGAAVAGFGDEVGRYFHDLLESKGIEMRGGEELRGVRGRRAGAARADRERARRSRAMRRRRRRRAAGHDARRARRARGRRRDRLRRGAARPRPRGSSPRATAAATRASCHGRRLRVEHWDVAFQQGRHAARGMLGEGEPYRVVPYFFSDLADWAGPRVRRPAERWDEVVWRGDRDAGEFSAWYLKDGRVVGGALGRPLRGPHARPPADRVAGGRVGAEGRAGRPGCRSRRGRLSSNLGRQVRPEPLGIG